MEYMYQSELQPDTVRYQSRYEFVSESNCQDGRRKQRRKQESMAFTTITQNQHGMTEQPVAVQNASDSQHVHTHTTVSENNAGFVVVTVVTAPTEVDEVSDTSFGNARMLPKARGDPGNHCRHSADHD